MPSKLAVTIGIIVGSLIGSYVPVFFGADMLSYSSALGSGIGSLLGIFIVVKLAKL
jgi:hypothetical protein